MNLNKDEKVINKITNPVSILEQQKYVPCNITITNQRFLIERDGILKDFKLSELESFRYVKNMIYKSGLQLKLKNGFTYDLALTKPDSLLHKIEAITLSKIPESGEPIVNKAANAFIYICLIVILIPILYFSYYTFDNYRFNSNPIHYIKNSSELSDDANYRSNDLVGYPYLHGTWEQYDSDSETTRRLLVMMYDDGEYKKGRYIVKQDKSEGKDFYIKLQGEFTLKKSKDTWGDESLIAHDKKLLKELSQYENQKYPFLISKGGSVRLGPSGGYKVSVYGERMKKISNRSFSIKSKSNSNSVNSNTSTNSLSKKTNDEVKKVIPAPTPEIIEVVEDEEEIQETVIESTEINEEKIDENGNVNYKFNGEDFYIIAVDVASDENEAAQKVSNLKSQGYNSDYLWIAQYSSLSGANLYSVFIGPFFNIEECALKVEEYRKIDPLAYGLLVSNKSPERVEIRGPGRITRK